MTRRVAPTKVIGLCVLCAINVGFGLIAFEEFFAEDRAPAKTAEWKPKLVALNEGMPSPTSIEAYQQILAHPIFFQSRTSFVPPPSPLPAAPAKVVPPPPVTIDPGLVLGGVIIDRDNRRAYLFSKANPRGSWVNEGSSFMGWAVRSVTASAARLEQADRSIELELYPAR